MTLSQTSTTRVATPVPAPNQTAERLRQAGVRRVFSVGDDQYAPELTLFNRAVTHAPEVVVAATCVEDVVATVAVANELDLTIAVLGHGHGVLKGCTGGIALTTHGLAEVTVDEVARTARIGAGTTWAAVLEHTTPFGLAPLCGSAPHVGVVGYLMGGGLGPVARTYGFAADHVRSVSVVTGSGELVVADPEHHSDLFWAVRGGKGGFGVVVEVTIDLFEMATIFGGGMYFAAEDAHSVLSTFSDWSSRLPETVSTSVAMLRLPPLPQVPEPLRGKFVVHVRVAAVGDLAEAEELVAPMLASATPVLNSLAEMPYAQIGSIHSDPVDPMPVLEGGILLQAFDAEAVDALLGAAGPAVDVPLVAVEVRLLGGAVARPPAIANAVGGRGAAYGLHVVSAPVPELFSQVIPATIHGVFDAMRPWQTGGSQINFFGSANDPATLERAWPPAVAERLRAVRAQYDPRRRFPFGVGSNLDHQPAGGRRP
jgi:hypothetical protein